MRTSTTLWMAAMGLVSYHDSLFTMAQAAPAPARPEERPRYYFPRHIKRQFPNSTAIDLPAVVAASSSVLDFEPTSTEIIMSTVFASSDPAAATPAAVSSAPASPPLAPLVELPPASSSIALVASSGPVPDVIVPAASSPAAAASSPAAAASSPAAADPSAGATGILPLSLLPAAASTQTPAAKSSDAPAILPLVVGSTGVIPDTILQPSSTPAAATPAASTSPTAIIVGLSTIISGTDLSAAPTLVSLPAAATTLLNSGLTGAGTGLLPAVSTGATSPGSATTGTPIVPAIISDVSTALSAAPTGSPISIVPVASPTLPTSGITGATTGVSPSPTDVISSAAPTLTGTGVSVTPGTDTTTTPTGSVTPTSGLAAATTTAVTSPSTTPTGTETLVPVSSSGLAAPVSTPTTTAVSTSAAIVPLVIVSTPTISIPNSIVPTGTDTMTIMTQPTSILVQSSVVGQSTTTSAGIPSSMPKVITPPGGNAQKPANTTLVQIGFTHELNYAFVSSNPASAGQIFSYLPQGVKWGLAIAENSQDAKDTRMYNLQPYDTSKTMGYITTLALMYISSDAVNQLAVDLHTPNSPLYNNPDPTIATLMSFINPTIPLIAGQPLDGTAPTTSAPATTSAGAAGGAAPFGGDAQNSEKVKTSAVALGLPIAAGVVLYGAAMALVARRYRKRRGAHRRTSSLNSDPAWMSGARSGYSRNSRGSGSSQGRSIRTQQISAPVMAGNSLGWN